MGTEFSTRRQLVALIVLGSTALGLAYLGEVSQSQALIDSKAYHDPDSYMWVNRVREIRDSGEWFDHTVERIDPPLGHEQHWTRPFDVVLLGGALLLEPVTGFESGLYHWSLFLSPLAHIMTMVLLLWAALPLVRREMVPRSGLGILVLVFVAQLPIYQSFLLGRPDHQVLLALLFAAYLGFWFRMVLEEGEDLRGATWLGIISAVAIWVSIESLLFIAIGCAGLGVWWLWQPERSADRIFAFGASLFLTLSLALLLERGFAGFGLRATDTLSLSHVGLGGLTCMAGFWIWFLRRSRILRNWDATAGGLTGVVVLTLLFLLFFPEFLRSPLGEVDPLYRATRLNHIVELQPIGTVGRGRLGYASAIVLFIGVVFPTIPFLVTRSLRPCSQTGRAVWLTLLMFSIVYLLLSLPQRRWSPYLSLAVAIPYAAFVKSLFDRLKGASNGKLAAVARSSVLLFLISGHIVLGVAGLILGDWTRSNSEGGYGNPAWNADSSLAEVQVPARQTRKRGECDLEQAGRILSDPRYFTDGSLILAWADYGPELLYRTRHSVLSIPNHRNQPGYTFTSEVMGTGMSPNAASQLLRTRGVDVILLCARDAQLGFSYRGLPQRQPGARDRFVDWLVSGGVPEGYRLHASTLSFRLLRRVDGTRSAGEYHRPG